MNTKSGLEATNKALVESSGRALNERSRLKIAIKEIMTELGHDPEAVDDAIQDVCNCDFRLLRTMFKLPAGESKAVRGYASHYLKPEEIEVGDEYKLYGTDVRCFGGTILTTDKLIYKDTTETSCHLAVYRDLVYQGTVKVAKSVFGEYFERVEK